MIRGVNRQIIEINNTGNPYFERALLFVKPEYAAAQEGRLRAEADRLIAGLGRPPQSDRTARRRGDRAARAGRRRWAAIAVCVFLGAALAGYLVLTAVMQ